MAVNNKNPKSNTRDVSAALRATKAMQLRASKMPYEQIAKECGYANKAAAHNAVQRELNNVIVLNVEELRQEELAMLEQLQAEVWPLVLNKENKARLFAVDRILAISERRCKLMGLDQTSANAVAAMQVIIRDVPANYLGEPEK